MILTALQKIEYAADLYKRRTDAVPLRRQAISLAGWTPQPNDCHANALTLARLDRNYEAVHGWVCADYSDVGLFSFFAHSVVRDPHRILLDITPNPLSWAYPFLKDNGSASEFTTMIFENDLVRLDHLLAGD